MNREKTMNSKIELTFEKTYKKPPANTAFCPYRICPLGAHSDHQLGKITGLAIDKGIIHVGFAMHEQYFYPGYTAYQYNYREKVETAVKKMTDNGYEAIFYEDYLPKNI